MGNGLPSIHGNSSHSESDPKPEKPRKSTAQSRGKSAEKQAKANVLVYELSDASVSMPWMLGDMSGYQRRRLDIRLSSEQADSVNRIYRALEYQGAALENGMNVKSVNSAVQWMIEHVQPLPAKD